MLDFSSDAIAMLTARRDASGNIVDFTCTELNPAACRVLKTERRRVLGASLLTILPGHDGVDGLFGKYRAVVESGEGHDVEFPYDRDGLDGWWRNIAVKHGDGVLVRFTNITEQRREQIHAQRLAVIVEQSADFIGISHPDGRVDFVNDAGLRMVGLPDMASAGRTAMADYFQPESRRRMSETAVPVMEREGFWEGEVELRDFRSGKALPVHYSLFPVLDAGQRTVAYATVARDISGSREMTDALRVSESKFRAIADTMPQMVWSTTPDGLHDYYNARWYEFTGVPEGSTDGEGWNGMFHPDDQPRAWEKWRRSLETGELYEIEYRLRHHSGQYRWTLGRALPIRDEAGVILRWFGTCTDIHDTRMHTDRLHNAQLRLQLALAAAAIGVWEYDPALDLVEWDERIRAATGRTNEDGPFSFSRDFLPLVNPDDRERVRAAIEEAAASGKELALEYRIRPAGSPADVWVSSAGRRVLGEDGSVRVIGTAMDISEDVRALEEQEVVAQELSHRIKNIFSVISGMIGLSARTYPETRPLADKLRERIAALGRAHDFVRPNKNRAIGAPAATLQGLAAQIFEPYGDDQGSPIVLLGDDLPIDDRAATPLALLFHELATNAAKYGALSTREGRVTITIATGPESVSVDWKETGGPPITSPPERRGFGSRLTSLSVEAQLGGTIKTLWCQDGLHSRIEIPASSFSRT